MNGLVARKAVTPPTGHDDEIDDGGATVTSSAFWPPIRLADVRRDIRLSGKVTTDRLMHAVAEAVLHANQQLVSWQAEQEALGFSTLKAIPAPPINDTTALVFRYRRAVYCFAKALLTEGYRDIDTTRDGEKHAEALATQIDSLWRDGQNAIRDLLGRPRMVAALV